MKSKTNELNASTVFAIVILILPVLFFFWPIGIWIAACALLGLLSSRFRMKAFFALIIVICALFLSYGYSFGTVESAKGMSMPLGIINVVVFGIHVLTGLSLFHLGRQCFHSKAERTKVSQNIKGTGPTTCDQ